jgi:hypothetical protein
VKLGILVNSDRHAQAVAAITRAAVAKRHEVVLFAMDAGTRLLEDAGYLALCELPGVSMSFCEESARRTGARLENLPGGVAHGSQLQNAMMMREAERVIVL